MDENTIQGIGFAAQEPGAQSNGRGAGKAGSFEAMLKQSINTVNRMQMQANHEVDKLASGATENIHETMIAMEKASISFELMMQVRNRLIEAYQEIINKTM